VLTPIEALAAFVDAAPATRAEVPAPFEPQSLDEQAWADFGFASEPKVSASVPDVEADLRIEPRRDLETPQVVVFATPGTAADHLEDFGPPNALSVAAPVFAADPVLDPPPDAPEPDLVLAPAPGSTYSVPASTRDAAESPFAPEAPSVWWRSSRAVAALVALVVAQTLLIGWLVSRPSGGLGGDGELVIQSRPEGARIVIDDREHGVTPLTVRVPPGTHVLQVRAGTAEPRVIPLVIRSGVQTAQYVELMGVATTGVLEVRSDPSKARVTIDGQARGSTPLTLRDVAPGDYEVVVERAGRKTAQVVRVEPGATAQLVVPIR
jgi:PEGA domain